MVAGIWTNHFMPMIQITCFFSIDIFLGNFAYILKIHIVKCIRYVIESTACMQNNGGCSTFCLPTPTGRACACEEGVDLMADGKTCEVSGGKKTISSCCFQLHYIVFLYMYSLFYFNKQILPYYIYNKRLFEQECLVLEIFQTVRGPPPVTASPQRPVPTRVARTSYLIKRSLL